MNHNKKELTQEERDQILLQLIEERSKKENDKESRIKGALKKGKKNSTNMVKRVDEHIDTYEGSILYAVKWFVVFLIDCWKVTQDFIQRGVDRITGGDDGGRRK
ncbi:hypothetical protein MTQ93_09620 [Staphylococcus agnetis]|uniref:hypothetical protein n=1 Tax=Staphylococcus agnetis TaxID=985762 RepID=UPI00208F140A|nr:hypothetical protein [Staphylococcus agnetis]MCO4346302.1 hypothetical protein [Staphylococcus agnetis]MCO4360622.1 hypothetical protein [Staphylococcus agnetis]